MDACGWSRVPGLPARWSLHVRGLGTADSSSPSTGPLAPVLLILQALANDAKGFNSPSCPTSAHTADRAGDKHRTP